MNALFTEEEARVLGVLIEKERTTPDYYPMTLNGLKNACNQKSNRNPVVNYDESTIIRALDKLRDKGFANRIHAADARVPKFDHKMDRALTLSEQELSLLCVLMLRGPQTVGELRGRCERLYPFDSMEEVRVTLDMLSEGEEPRVMRLPVQPGQKEARYTQLLTGEPDPEELQQAAQPQPVAAPAAPADNARLDELENEVLELRQELETLKKAFDTSSSCSK